MRRRLPDARKEMRRAEYRSKRLRGASDADDSGATI